MTTCFTWLEGSATQDERECVRFLTRPYTLLPWYHLGLCTDPCMGPVHARCVSASQKDMSHEPSDVHVEPPDSRGGKAGARGVLRSRCLREKGERRHEESKTSVHPSGRPPPQLSCWHRQHPWPCPAPTMPVQVVCIRARCMFLVQYF